jgi:hypothetical protein
MAMPTGLGQGGRVVDAVAGHGDDAALGREFFDDAVLVLRQDVGFDLLDAELAGDGFGGRLVVAGQHDDPDAVAPQLIERGCVVDLIGSAMAMTPPGLPSTARNRAVAPSPRSSSAFWFKIAERDAEVRHQLGVAERHGPAADLAGDALAGDGREVGRFLDRQLAIRLRRRRWPPRADVRSTVRGWPPRAEDRFRQPGAGTMA